MAEIRFIDTTLRDGQQSLWALGMGNEAMLSIAEHMDRCGFESMEFFVSVMIKKYVRELKQDPWEWLRLGTQRFNKTRLRYHGGMHSAFEKTPSCILRLLVERLVAMGITLTRTSNPWNDYVSFKEEVGALRRLGMETVVNLIYSVSPRHTDEYYARKAREAAAIGPYRVCFKDVGGLLTPDRARALIPVVLENAGDVPVEFHAHCNSGLAPLCYLEAIQLGVTTLHTAVPPLANGSSQPSIFNIARNVRALGHTPVVDEAAAKTVEERLTRVARENGHPVGRPAEFDHGQYLHQIPGGMISNLRHQLRMVGMEDKLQATLEEAGRVRAEFGYPIMVTPLSQFVGTQAAMNVIVGERYKEVPDQVIQYALGIWGKEAPEIMDPDVKERILGRPRAKEWAGWEPPEPSLEEVRRQFGGRGVSDEELILRVYAGEDYVNGLKAAAPVKAATAAATPLVELLREFAGRRSYRYVSVKKPGLKLTLGRIR